MLIALTRDVSPRISECELTFHEREPIDAVRAASQHQDYERRLEGHGCHIVRIPPAPDFPDGVFVEDAAVVLDEVAVITRPGATSRRGELESVDKALQTYRRTLRMHEGSLDGGDVLRVGRTLYAGQTQRTSNRGIARLRAIVEPYGYKVVPVPVRNCLHLKSAATALGGERLLFNPECVDERSLSSLELIAVHPHEPLAANVLSIDGVVMMADAYPRTRRILEDRGFRIDAVPISELQKAEAGMTCCSLIFPA